MLNHTNESIRNLEQQKENFTMAINGFIVQKQIKACMEIHTIHGLLNILLHFF